MVSKSGRLLYAYQKIVSQQILVCIKTCWDQRVNKHPLPITYLKRFIFLYSLHFLNMPRQKWATKEQEEWLEERNPAFFLANQKKAAAKEFFPLVVQEFRDKWPMPEVTQEEINENGSLELATRVKKIKYDKV
jgi:hypothetical protein